MSRAVHFGQYGKAVSDRYHDLADGLALAVTDPDSTATGELMTFLGGLTGPGGCGWMSRRGATTQGPGCTVRWLDGSRVLAPRYFPHGRSLASMAHSVCVRETAVSALGRIAGPVASAALAVRVTDWVPEVSAAASSALASWKQQYGKPEPGLPDCARRDQPAARGGRGAAGAGRRPRRRAARGGVLVRPRDGGAGRDVPGHVPGCVGQGLQRRHQRGSARHRPKPAPSS